MIRIKYLPYAFFVLMVTSSCHGFKYYSFEDDISLEQAEEMFKDPNFQRIQIIFPGTKWCGTGDIAEHDDDLGPAIETDKCCREHDWCDDIIEAGQTKYDLINKSFYTKLHCKCDLKFFECLSDANSLASKTVANIYFNILGTNCYKHDHPIIDCAKYDNIMKRRCIDYNLNADEEKIWDWFDVPVFKKFFKVKNINN